MVSISGESAMIATGKLWEEKMKCPKWCYISLDHKERCPKCNNGLARERKAFDFIAFTYNSSSLFESLAGEDLGIHLDGEDLSESLLEKEFSLDLADLEDEIGGLEARALESPDSGNVSLDETVPELDAAQEIGLVD
jgi:hypothetical protein